MKKLIKYFCVLSFLLLVSLVGVACGEPSLEKIDLSIDSAYATYIGGNKGYVVVKKEGETPIIPITVVMTPQSFSASDISWDSTYKDVAIVNNGVATCKWTGASDKTTIITATYSKGDNKVSASILLTITSKPLPKFEESKASIVYQGKDVKDNFKVLNSDGYTDGFVYQYRDIKNGIVVDEIISCGEYRITYCYNKNNELIEYARMEVTVLPYTLKLSSKSGTSMYGKDLEDGFYSTYDETTIEQNGEDIQGGVGKDVGTVLGKMICTTKATSASPVGRYETSVAWVLTNKNYQVEIETSTYTITERKVVMVVENQSIVYGAEPEARKFKLYDAEDYAQNKNSATPLGESYKSQVSTPNYSYLLNNQSVSKNTYGYLDSGSNYGIGYALTSINTTQNIDIIDPVVSGTLHVNKREGTISPKSKTKFYGEEDPNISYTATNILNENEINKNFLTIDYKLSKDYVLGDKNKKAPAGEYDYTVDNSLNKNYNFVIDKSTTAKFTVKKCPIVLNFETQNLDYQKPKSELLHTISYYGNTADYIIDIPSIKVADTTYTVYKENDPNKKDNGIILSSDGGLLLPLGDVFSFTLRLVANQNSQSYVGYKALLDSTKTVFSVGNMDNYDISLPLVATDASTGTYTYFEVNLSKLTVSVIPNAQEEISYKTYDAISGVDDTITTFLSKFVLSNGEDYSTILEPTSEVLTLRNKDGKYLYRQDEKNNYVEVDAIRDAGMYKVFLSSNLSFQKDKEYIDLKLDDEKDYYFTISPRLVVISPEDGQTKVYCDKDPELLYVEDSSTPLPEGETNLVKVGALSRAEGEDVGQYEISLGSLSYGKNYTLEINTTKRYFEITQRTVYVTPFSYTVTYGDTLPTIEKKMYVKGTYDETLYTTRQPQLKGNFAIKYNNNKVEKIGEYYPVTLDNSGNPVSYVIDRDLDLNLTDTTNYILEFTSSTLLIKPRELNINLNTKLYSGTDAPKTGELLDCTLGNTQLVKGEKLEVRANKYVFENTAYSVSSLDDLDITLTHDGKDVKDCYKITLGQKVAFTLAKTIIEFKIVTAMDKTKNQSEVTFDGKNKDLLFMLEVATEGYELSIDDSGKSSKYNLDFSNSSGTAEPINVGSYVVGASLGDGDKIVIRNSSQPTSKPIVFTSFGEVQEDNYVAILSQKGYLTINKANLTCDKSLLGFESALSYSSQEDQLPNLATKVDDKNVFVGVDGNAVSLATCGGHNYELKYYTTPIEMLKVGTHIITVTVYASDEKGEVNNNYNSLTIDVPLKIVEKEIAIDGGAVSLESNQGDDLSYDGYVKTFTLSLGSGSQEIDSQKYNIGEYVFYKLSTKYDDAVAGKVQQFTYDGTRVSPNKNGEDNVYVTIEELGSMQQTDIELVTYNSIKYIVIGTGSNSRLCYQLLDIKSPQDAGIYICRARIVANDNYALKISGSASASNNINFIKPFEIKRLGEVEIINWKEEFPYGTVFNVSQQDTLPFEFATNPSCNDDIEFVVTNEDESAWAESNYVLKVSNEAYKIGLKIDTTNCFYYIEKDFYVICREAKFFFPEGDNNYEYSVDDKGVAQPQTTFLNSVYVTYVSSDNIETKVKYSEATKDYFTFEYYKASDEKTKLATAPSEIGEYFVIGRFSSNNYAGSARYDYRIAQKRYTGSISSVNIKVNYDPEYTASEIREKILKMLICSDESAIDMAGVSIIDSKLGMLTFDDENEHPEWLKDFIDCKASRKITFDIPFVDKTIANKDDVTAELTFVKTSITSSVLKMKDSISTYVYNGYPVYKELTFKDTPIAPNKEGGTTETTSDSLYTMTYGEQNSKGYDRRYVKVSDKLGNLIFKLKYEYYKENESGEFDLIDGGFPISPNIVNGEIKRYKVKYLIELCGDNYKLDASLSDFYFTIQKASTLYLEVSPLATSYNGTDLSGQFDKKCLSLTNSATKAVNFQLYKYDSNLTFDQYDEENGICFIYSITTEDGVLQSNVINAGSYKINISLLALPSFDPTNYFEKISIGDKNYSSQAIVDEGYGGQWTYSLATKEVAFTVNQANFPYDITSTSKIEEFLSISNYKLVEEEGKNVIEIAVNATFELNEQASSLFSLTFKKGTINKYNSFSELTVEGDYTEYTFEAICLTSNYGNSEQFTIRVYSVDAWEKK